MTYIKSKERFAARLQCDDNLGIIKLVLCGTIIENQTISIASNDVPINEHVKNMFTCNRTCYYIDDTDTYKRSAMILKSKDPDKYNAWKDYIIDEYNRLRRNYRINTFEK